MTYKPTNNMMILYLEVRRHARKSNQNVTTKVTLSDLGVRKQVVN